MFGCKIRLRRPIRVVAATRLALIFPAATFLTAVLVAAAVS